MVDRPPEQHPACLPTRHLLKRFRMRLLTLLLIGNNFPWFSCAFVGSTTTTKTSLLSFFVRQSSSTQLDATHTIFDDFKWYSLRHRSFFVATSFLFRLPSFSHAATDLKEEYCQGTATLANMDADAPVPREAYKKLPSGVVYADI